MTTSLPCPSLLRRLALAGLVALLAGCQSESPALVPVTNSGTPVSTVPAGEAPDDYAKQLGFMGAHLASLFGSSLPPFAALFAGYYDASVKHHRPGYRVLSGVPGWDYRNGWYWHETNDAARTLRAQFESQEGQAPTWDVTLDANYEPELHDAFPTDLVRFRLVLDQATPTGGRVGATLLAVIPADRNDPFEVFGSGSAAAPNSLGSVAFEALNATMSASGAVERGDMVLKLLRGGATYQFTGKFGGNGLAEYAKVYKNAQPVGEVGHFDGKWHLFNQSGRYALE